MICFSGKMKKFGLLVFALGAGLTACGPMIQLIDVEVKLPASHPVSFNNREIAIFNALYDHTATPQESEWNDSLLINKVAEGFRDQLAADLLIDSDSISVFNHFCGQTARGDLDDKEYIYSLSELTGAQTLVLIDSLWRGDFEYVPTKSAAVPAYSPLYVSATWQMVFRIFDMKDDQFIARLVIKDTLHWVVIAQNGDSSLIETKLLLSMPETAHHLGAAVAQITLPQWETQERALFFFSGASWEKALEHAFMFEWEEAQRIWLSLTKDTKNYKKIAYAAYNLAVASEMMGQFDLAREWLHLAGQYITIPEITLYLQMLDERKQQRQVLLMQVD